MGVSVDECISVFQFCFILHLVSTTLSSNPTHFCAPCLCLHTPPTPLVSDFTHQPAPPLLLCLFLLVSTLPWLSLAACFINRPTKARFLHFYTDYPISAAVGETCCNCQIKTDREVSDIAPTQWTCEHKKARIKCLRLYIVALWEMHRPQSHSPRKSLTVWVCQSRINCEAKLAWPLICPLWMQTDGKKHMWNVSQNIRRHMVIKQGGL